MHRKLDIYANVPKTDRLGFQGDLSAIPDFLDLTRDDLSKAANVSKSSVRYDNRIPKDLEKLLCEIAAVCELVAEYFDGDQYKTALWFKLENPALGGISPRDMIRYGRFEKLRQFIINRKEGYLP